jgi:broad specificity phosphatase PhoE
MTLVYFITHPNVVIDPKVPVPRWRLSLRGQRRMMRLLAQPWIERLGAVYCSTEQKAIDGAEILAGHLGTGYEMVADLGENDRSATGYLPADEFRAVAGAFFARPDESVRGWERACDAQQRIVGAVERILAEHRGPGDIAIVAHGGVGALLLCNLKGVGISARESQPGANGGNYYCFEAESWSLVQDWRTIGEDGG